MSIFKKLLITLMILLAAAGGWYFLYWQNTPAFAAGEIQQAVQKKDWDLFCKRVDVAKVYSYALDDMLAELKADGLPEHAIAASLVKSIKKEVVKELIRQTEIRFKDGAPASKSLLDKPVKTLTAYAGSSALSPTSSRSKKRTAKPSPMCSWKTRTFPATSSGRCSWKKT